ncbi:MAG: cytochrome b/b6 domain-containing protein [Pseudomonadota bacterium]|nr:cytochrome b/b6 domain-containing protein [Pseudomonadota bacterium]
MDKPVRRFTRFDRLTHLWLILTFMVLAITGTGRLYDSTYWGRSLLDLFGGEDQAILVHIWAGWLMTIGFGVHILYLFTRVRWRAPGNSLFGPDSLVPVWRDFKQFGQQVLWFFGIGRDPEFERWTYWEKFDYWAVFWGIPILFVTGLMLIYPVETARVVPGWTLNVALLIHRAEAILAVSYIILIHLMVGHFRRSTFPLNEAMFSGSVPLERLKDEKPLWVARLDRLNQLKDLATTPPALWFRMLYFVFGYAVIGLGVYLVIWGIYYSRFVSLH